MTLVRDPRKLSWAFLKDNSSTLVWDFFFYNLFLVDYDAPLSEAGDVTKKFWALSKIFKEYNPRSNDKGWSIFSTDTLFGGIEIKFRSA